MTEKKYDVIIIGSGIVGLAGAVYCGRLGLKCVVIGGEKLGTLAKTNVVENYPGFSSISGSDLVEKVLEHAKEYDVDFVDENVVEVMREDKNCFVVNTRKKSYEARAILFATGSKWKKLGIVGEEEFSGKGVHNCALCDGPLYKGKVIAVAGGGDSAAKEALLLAEYAEKIYILARSKLKAEPINMERVKNVSKIEVVENIEIKEIKGSKFVEGVVLSSEFNGSNELSVNGVFVDVGHVPLSSLAVELGVKVNESKEIIIDKESKTNVTGVYAAGDVTDTKFKQAVTGVGEAVKAIYSIYEDLRGGKLLCNCVDENC